MIGNLLLPIYLNEFSLRPFDALRAGFASGLRRSVWEQNFIKPAEPRYAEHLRGDIFKANLFIPLPRVAHPLYHQGQSGAVGVCDTLQVQR